VIHSKSIQTLTLAMIIGLFQNSAGWAQSEKAKAAPKAKTTAKKAATPKWPIVKPTKTDVPYGTHPRQKVDFYQAPSDKPTPVILFIHGGGWMNGDKNTVQNSLNMTKLFENGISVVSVQYRLIPDAQENGAEPPVKWPLEDAKRALQFVRSKSKEWNLDKERIAASGGSAGGCSSLWLAMHDDMADAQSDDPVARESTRLWGVVVSGPQTSLDPKMTREWMPNMAYGGHAFGFRKVGQERSQEFQTFYENRDKVLPWIREYSPMELLTMDDPPMIMLFNSTEKAEKGKPQKDPTHSPLLGKMLEEKAKPLGVRTVVAYQAEPHADYRFPTESLILLLNEKR
jgi:acetyl esterase/lipase